MESRSKTRVEAKGAQESASQDVRPDADSSTAKLIGKPLARILVVEDQEDVRRMLATALELDGYQVDEADNAQEGLRLLGQREYQLVLSDYAMPSGTGAWMIEEASRRGLMTRTRAMIVTAHPDVRGWIGVAVIHKPLDLDEFLAQVRLSIGQQGRAARA
jgi:DNA-binding response OmpR family regulator